MPTTTTLGFPIPNDSDPMADLALAVRNLAQYVDDNVGKVAIGQSTITVTAANTGDLVVNFPAGRFAAGQTPRVVAQVADSSNNFMVHVPVISNTQMTLRAIHRDAASTTTTTVVVNWIAVYQ